MGGLSGLMLFFGILFSGMFFNRGNVPLGVLFVLVAATPVAFLVYGAARNRRRSLARDGRAERSTFAADPTLRRTARLAGGVAAMLGAAATIATLVCVVLIMADPPSETMVWFLVLLVIVVLGLLAAGLIVSSVRLFRFAWQGAATTIKIMYMLAFVAGLTVGRSIVDIGERWPVVLDAAAIVGVAVGVITLQKRALLGLCGPDGPPQRGNRPRGLV